jgi:tRNA nucleotidyltransferase/poly(A) polymerase
MPRHSGGGSLTNSRRRRTLRKREPNSIRQTKSHSPYTSLKRKTLRRSSNLRNASKKLFEGRNKKEGSKEKRVKQLKKQLAELEAKIAENDAEDEAEANRRGGGW